MNFRGHEQMDKLNDETIKNYQTFAAIEDMDQAVRGFLYQFKSSLSNGALKVLHFLWHYSVKVVGVSFAKYDTIAEAVGLSRRTVIRAVKMLEELLFIKKIPTARMNGKQGVNLFVIQPFETIDSLLDPLSPQDVTHSVTPNKTENKQSSLCENKKQNRMVVREAEVKDSVGEIDLKTARVSCTHTDGRRKINQELSNGLKQKEKSVPREVGHQMIKPTTNGGAAVQVKTVEVHQLDTSFLPEYVNKVFIRAAQPFFHAGDMYKLWTKTHLAYRKIQLEAHLDDVITLEPFDTFHR